MKKNILVLTAAVLLAVNTCALAFSDINEADRLMQIRMERLTSLHIINGYEDGTFRPDNEISRAEMLAVAAALLTLPKDTAYDFDTPKYSDVNSTHWAYGYIKQMDLMGYINGYDDGTFRPDNSVTCAEAVKLIVSIAGYGSKAEENGGYPGGYMNTAKEIGILDDLTIEPDDKATRETVAVMADNVLDVPVMIASGFNAETQTITYEVSEKTLREIIIENYEEQKKE